MNLRKIMLGVLGFAWAVSSLGVEVEIPAMTTVETPVCYSGLLQGKINSANDFTTDIRANSVTSLEVMPGAMMAGFKVESGQQERFFYTNPYTGNSHKWNESNTTFGYYGEIYLTEGATLNVGKNVDDSGFVKIGETIVLQDTTHSAASVASFTASNAGWYPIELRVGDGSGAKGVYDTTKFNGLGLAYNFGETTDPDATGWKPFVDERHDGSFLRSPDSAHLLQMSTVKANGDDVEVWLGTVDAVPTGTQIVAYYGTTDYGEKIMGWENARVLAAAATDQTFPATKYTLEGLAQYGALRFALVMVGSETVQGWTQFSPVTEFVQIVPCAAFDFDGEATEDTVNITVRLTALGLNANTATVYAELSRVGDFSDAVRTKLDEAQAVKTFSATLSGLAPTTEYTIRLVIENDLGKTYTTGIKTFSTYDVDAAHPGDTLVWAGGATGTWNASDAVWGLPNGKKVAWLDGCSAKFTNDTTVTVAGGCSAISIDVAANVVMTGNQLAFDSPVSVVYYNNGSIRFENEVKTTADLTFAVREQHDVIYQQETPGDLTDEAQLLFHNVKLADVDAVIGHFYGDFGSAHRDMVLRSDEPPTAEYGVFHQTKTDTEFTAQFQLNTYGSGGANNIIKVYLYQVGDDVWGKYHYSVSYWGGNGKGWAIGDDYDALVAKGEIGYGYGQRIGELELRTIDHLPTEMNAEFAGGYKAHAVATTVDAGTLTFSGTGELDCQLHAQNGGSVVFAKDSAFTIPGVNACRFAGSPYYVYGTLTVADNENNGNYDLLRDARSGFYVCDGGRFISNEIFSPYGYSGCTITVLKGGVLETPVNYSIGCNDNKVILLGGRWLQSCDFREEHGRYIALKDIMLSDGAVLEGYIGSMGIDYYNHESVVRAGGAAPSSITLEAIRLGSTSKHITASGYGCRSEIRVPDVTGDAASDLLISSSFEDAGGMEVDVGSESCYRLRKTEAGTLELTAKNSSAPLCQFQLEAGTVKLGEGSKAEFGTFALTGDGAFDVTAAGSAFVFANSRDIAWSADKTLTVVGYHRRGLRFGTDAQGLTSEQLTQIKFAEKPAFPATLDANGYLQGPQAGTVITVR